MQVHRSLLAHATLVGRRILSQAIQGGAGSIASSTSKGREREKESERARVKY